MSIRLFYCFWSSPSIYDSAWGCLRQTSHDCQTERADSGSVSNCVLCTFTVRYSACTFLSAHISPYPSTPFMFSGAKHNANQQNQPIAVDYPHLCFSTQVTFDRTNMCIILCRRNQHRGIMTSNGVFYSQKVVLVSPTFVKLVKTW